jgi:WhiB family redox-sensing transcriptional regulator
MDTEAFYDPDQVDDAKAVCTSCPVRTPCLATALLHRKQHGVRGGLSEEERRRLITRIRRMVA